MDARILLGVIGRPHGVRGLVRVVSHTEDPAALAGYGPLTDERGRRWTLAWRGEGIAELRDEAGRSVADRNEAEALVNLRLYADRDRLPRRRQDEFYLADLIGLSAVDRTGASLGRSSACMTTGPARRWRSPRGDVAAGAVHPCRGAGGRSRGRKRDRVSAQEPCSKRPRAMTWRASVLTLFPEMFPGPLGHSLPGRALADGCVVARGPRHPRPRHRPAPQRR